MADNPIGDKVPERAQVLRRAESLVCGDRREEWVPVIASFDALASLWSTLTGMDFTAIDVALCMKALKMWRCSTSPGSMDSWTDVAGYAALGWEVAIEMDRRRAAKD